MVGQIGTRWLPVATVAAVVLLGGAASLNAQSASFDCTKATAPDELTICASPELAGLDRLVAAGYQDLQRSLGTAMANRIHLPFLRARRACESDAFCIFERQVAEIPSFRTLGVKVEPPPWLTSINTPDYDQLKTMLKVGECAVATITEISYRLCAPDHANVCIPSPGSGSAVTLSNGISGVSYEQVGQIHRSEVGDTVIACLSEVPKDCPPGDDRGYVWAVTNQSTGESWQLPDSEHQCGGA